MLNMHELSIAQALMEKIAALAKEQDAESVTRVHIEAGALSGVNPEALELAFPVAAENTVAQKAELIIEKAPAEGECGSCGNNSQFDPIAPFCPVCGSADLNLTSGRQLLLKRVELLQKDKPRKDIANKNDSGANTETRQQP